MRARRVTVRHYGPGGREHGGGIGRFIGYVTDAAAELGEAHAVTDTRGPAWTIPDSLLRLARAVVILAVDRLRAPMRIHHIHLAGRGSTMRKLVLTAAARRFGCRHVLHLHDYDYAGDYARRDPTVRAAIRHMFRHADAVVVLGRADRRLVVDTFGTRPDRVAILHNAVPDPGPPPARPSGPPIILFLGRLGPRKGVDELLAALADPAMTGLSWRAILAGDGPVSTYRARARDLDLENRVAMPGWLDAGQTRALLDGASILVLPSHAEGMAMAVVEGLGHGVAVVTTNVGAQGEAITHGVTGIFVTPGDPTGLACALAGLVREPERRRELGKAGRELFISRFGMAGYMARLSAIYDNIFQKEARRTLPRGRGV